MRIQLASAIVRRHCLHRAEIYHVKGATRAYIGRLATHHRPEAVVSTCQNTSEQVVTDFGRGNVHHAGDKAVIQKFLHGLSAGTGRVTYQAVEAGTESSYP